MEVIKNQRGSIILSTLIYSAMVLFMSMMLLEFVKSHIYGQYAHIQRLNFEILKSNVESYLRRNDVCSAGLLVNGVRVQYPGPSPNGVSLTEIASAGQSFLKLNQPLGAGMSIQSIELRPDGTTPVTNGGETTHGVNLILRAKKAGAIFGGTVLDNLQNPIKLSISTDAAGNIQSCSSAATGSLDLTNGEQCSTANLTATPLTKTFPGGTYQLYYMIRLKNGATVPGGNMRFYCMTLPGAVMGYVTACVEGPNCP